MLAHVGNHADPKERDNMTHYHDPDPTPAHGTPRPKAYPCAWFACASFTAQPLSLCEVHGEFSEFGHAVELLETWVSDSADLDNKTDRTASMVLDQVLNALYGALTAWKCDDLQGLDVQIAKAAGLFGFMACDTCAGLVERVELDVNGMCQDCQDEAEHA